MRLLLGLLWSGFAVAQYDVGPVADWVTPQSTPTIYEIPHDEVSSGAYYLLVDRQIRIDANDEHRYFHAAWKILASSGLTDFSDFSIEFDPEYETITIHEVDLLRDGLRIPQLDQAKIEVLRREPSLESQIVDGHLTINVVLDDVRVGDVLEYSFTRSGRHPAFPDLAFDTESLEWSIPVARRYLRLLHPRERPLQVRTFVSEEQPVDAGGADWADLRWEHTALPAVVHQDEAPRWHHQRAFVQYSEFAAWDDLVEWALPIYQLPEPVPHAVADLAAEFQQQHPDDREAQLLAALDFVQEDIRYLGIELGEQSFVPSAPVDTLERRFGDCKDKTVLFLALARELGVTGAPVLANTWDGRALDRYLPSPGLFNHMVARVSLHGRTYLLDPTLTHQEGGIDELVEPDYGFVLPLAEGVAALVDSAPQHDAGQTVIEETFSAGETDADYRVRTEYTGLEADQQRRRLAETSAVELAQQFENFTAGYYANVVGSEPIRIEDDTAANRLILNEQYRVEPLWTTTEVEGRLETDFYAWDALSYLTDVDTPLRTAPLARVHPVSSTHTIRVALGPDWDLDDAREVVEDEQFRFSRSVRFDGEELTLVFKYETLDDHVDAARLGEFMERIEAARRLASYGLYKWVGDAAYEEDFAWLEGIEIRELVLLLVVTLGVGLAPFALLAFARANAHRSLWLAALAAPRETFARLERHDAVIPLLVIGYGIADTIGQLSFTDALGRTGGEAALIATILIGGAVAGAIRYYLGAGVWLIGARILSGKATFREMRHAYAWGALPAVMVLLVVTAIAIGTWPELFTVDGPVFDETNTLALGLTFGLSLQVIVLTGWALVNAIAMVAAANAFSILRSIMSALIGLLLVALIVIVFISLIAALARMGGA